MKAPGLLTALNLALSAVLQQPASEQPCAKAANSPFRPIRVIQPLALKQPSEPAAECAAHGERPALRG